MRCWAVIIVHTHACNRFSRVGSSVTTCWPNLDAGDRTSQFSRFYSFHRGGRFRDVQRRQGLGHIGLSLLDLLEEAFKPAYQVISMARYGSNTLQSCMLLKVVCFLPLFLPQRLVPLMWTRALGPTSETTGDAQRCLQSAPVQNGALLTGLGGTGETKHGYMGVREGGLGKKGVGGGYRGTGLRAGQRVTGGGGQGYCRRESGWYDKAAERGISLP